MGNLLKLGCFGEHRQAVIDHRPSALDALARHLGPVARRTFDGTRG
jgi:hypothetical protein